jgi:hypothetical protein
MDTMDKAQGRPAEDGGPVNLDPARVMEEVRRTVSLLDPDFDLSPVEELHADVARLFRGEYPDFQPCNTEYHDFKHTTDTLLAMARLMHGASVRGTVFTERGVILGLSSALFHDTGYIQEREDREGTGAKYTLNHIGRSIEFSGRYLREHGRPAEDQVFCRNCLLCTGFSTKPGDIAFQSEEERITGWMLGSADLLGQMADRVYLEKLLFLYREFREGNIPGFGSEYDLLEKTLSFYETTRRRMETDFGNVQEYMRPHFAVRWNLDRDLYRESMQRNAEYLERMILNAEDRYRDHLRRGGLVRKLRRLEA